MKPLEKVVDYVDQEALVALTQQLIRVKSVYDPEVPGANEEAVAGLVADTLRTMGLKVTMEEVVPGRPNVVGILEGGSPGKTLLMEGHTDVVTAGDLDEWTEDPFGGDIKGERIYGRGACDTKGNLAAAIMAVKAIQDAGIPFKGRILLCIPVDEEGLMLGIKDFIKRGWADAVDAAIICEPEENHLCITQKGALRIALRVFGKMAHGAMPLAGINPNWGMAAVITGLEKLEQAEIQRLGKDPLLGYPSITPTILKAPYKGEAQINVIPKECYMTLDIRTIPGQEHSVLIGQIQDILDRISGERPDFKAEMEVLEERPWTATDKEHPVVKAMDRAYRQVTGKEPTYNGVPGATDGTFLHAWKNIPIITTGAGDRLIPHQADEYVDIPQLVEACRLFALAALYYLNE
ncbi:M20 family metallopeptidase [Anoxynatronum buryatiense]|uniref:Probable succinyl-diaminopimelate desuccinylase n=1 Tax=Anoxynatronum buryatiense TaxID=489973 RepID=A0AA46AJE0_9CLOT|nr:M20 family metallopeptidase [Anoxynatronum buryatiense]SMP59982.1 succinyl-diaminopimelate desuccinylase [Anoxynatronum buryatiense]